jgi:hypothetical protein
MEESLLFWTMIGAVGQALGAFATALAVSVSLWIVLSERRPQLRISAGLRLVINGDGTPATDIISINIANVGLRGVTCTAFGWRTGYWKRGPAFVRRQLALQNAAYAPGSWQFPLTLEPGEEKSVYQDVQAYRAAMGENIRHEFFCRQLPFHKVPTPTRVDLIISLAAHSGIFKTVEPSLAHFLATGEIESGARRFNERTTTAQP